MTKADSVSEKHSPFDAVVKPLSPAPDLEASFAQFSRIRGCLLLDSAMRIQSPAAQPLGRYSFLMADPFASVVVPIGSPNPLAEIKSLLAKFRAPTIPGLPPMQGGVAGLFSYDLNRSWENIEPPQFDDPTIPAVVVGAYDTVVAWDHQLDQAWIISQGFPETDPSARKTRAHLRIEFFESLVRAADQRMATEPSSHQADDSHRDATALGTNESAAPLASKTAPRFPIDGPDGLTSDLSHQQYLDAVKQCIAYIHQGDVFQINFKQQLQLPANCGPVELYLRLRKCNPAPFSGYFDPSQMIATGTDRFHSRPMQIISASPERFFSVRDRIVETRPIKGTRKRTGHPRVDLYSQGQLLASVKDRAENTMIVDLMRNDLSRVCDDHSVRVTQLCELERYQSVLHLVSAVEGKLKPEYDLVDLLAAVFPGGSITGAPKVRAMEIISELEPTNRGAYCGSLGYLGFDGTADLNILIRTITASNGQWQIPVGGGIVAQSNPQHEYDETWTKAAGLLQAATSPNNLTNS